MGFQRGVWPSRVLIDVPAFIACTGAAEWDDAFSDSEELSDPEPGLYLASLLRILGVLCPLLTSATRRASDRSPHDTENGRL